VRRGSRLYRPIGRRAIPYRCVMAALAAQDTGNAMIPLPEVIEYLDDLPSEFAGSAFAALREPLGRAQRAPLIEILQPSAALSQSADDLLVLAPMRRRTSH
jgi:hypothetical protein